MDSERTVLFVDDEESVLNSIRRELRKNDFKVYTVIGGEAALAFLKKQSVQIIVTDQRMPVITGIQLLQKVKVLYPDTIRIILSGYADNASILDAINKGEVFKFLSKPWEKANLIKMIEESFLYYSQNQTKKVFMDKIINENKRLKYDLAKRDSHLNVNTSILNQVPMPILAVSSDFTIDFFNIESSLMIGKQIDKDAHLQDIFPDEISSKIIEGLSFQKQASAIVWNYVEKVITISIRKLRPTDSLYALLFFEVRLG